MITVLFDQDCGFCRWSAERLRAWDRHGHLSFRSIQQADADGTLDQLPVSMRLASWHAIDANARLWSAGAAVPVVLRELPGGRLPAALAARFPRITERIYAMIVRHRTWLGRHLGAQACSVDPRPPEAR